jgi:anti-anti-sigma factor
MDSSALGMLINMKKYWQDRDSNIRIINSSPQVKKIFAISRFDKKFTIE